MKGKQNGGYDGHRGIMNYLAISPDFRGKGFGKMLAEEVEKKLKQLGCPKVKLLVRSDNIEVRNFYESIDYKKQDDVSVFGKILTSSRTKMLELQRTGHKKIFDDLNENKTYNKTSDSKPISHCGIVV